MKMMSLLSDGSTRASGSRHSGHSSPVFSDDENSRGGDSRRTSGNMATIGHVLSCAVADDLRRDQPADVTSVMHMKSLGTVMTDQAVTSMKSTKGKSSPGGATVGSMKSQLTLGDVCVMGGGGSPKAIPMLGHSTSTMGNTQSRKTLGHILTDGAVKRSSSPKSMSERVKGLGIGGSLGSVGQMARTASLSPQAPQKDGAAGLMRVDERSNDDDRYRSPDRARSPQGGIEERNVVSMSQDPNLVKKLFVQSNRRLEDSGAESTQSGGSSNSSSSSVTSGDRPPHPRARFMAPEIDDACASASLGEAEKPIPALSMSSDRAPYSIW